MFFLRKFKLFHIFVIIAFAYLFAGCAAPGPQHHEPVKGNPKFWNSFYYTGTSGKVGHHMYAEPRATCGESWSRDYAKLVYGTLPPGLSMSGSRIQGTPRQPGIWKVTVRFINPQCRGKIYPNKDVDVTFNISGIAPRRIR